MRKHLYHKLTILLFGFISLAVLLSCEKVEEVSNNKTDTFFISYSKGSSWVGYFYEATMDQNGNIEIAEKNSLMNQSRNSKYQMTTAELNLMREKLNTLAKIDLLDQYGFDNENAPTDLPTKRLIYKTAIKSDSTSIYFPKENELPSEFNSFMETLNQVILDNDTLRNN